MKKPLTIIFLFLLFITVAQAEARIVNVPNTLTAPVMLYDEGGNVFTDGTYEITITLKDTSGDEIYEEEQEITVINGVAAILIGQGYIPGTNYGSAAGGLSVETFDVSGDISVEILVDGQSSPQQIATVSSQPYSFISEYAIGVASDAITTESIQDGTIIAADLDPSFLEELQTTSLVNESDSAITASDVSIPESTSLNNSGETTVNGVLEDFDNAIDTLRDVNIEQSIDFMADEISSTYIKKDGTSSMTGDLNMGTKAITNVGNVDGVDVSALSATISSLNSTYATDAELSAYASTVSSTLTALDSTYTTETELSAHASTSTGLHGLDSSSSVVGTASIQTLTNKTITSTNSISANAINSGTVNESYVDSDIARDSEVNASISILEASLGSIASETYTEGTYTPSISFSGGSGNVTPTYTTTSGRYTLIGRQVFVDILFMETTGAGTVGAGTGQIGISLPIVASSSHKGETFPCGTYYNYLSSSSYSWGIALGQIHSSASAIYLYKQISFSSLDAITGSDQNNSIRILRLKFNYEI